MTEVVALDVDAAAAAVAEGAVLLDVREPDEWAAGHAPGARHIPLGELAARAGELPRDRRIVAVCRSGHRSATATEWLVGAGYDAVNLTGGMLAWTAARRPAETDDGGAGRVI